ncbi:COBW domain-containing protein 1 [Coelomomyces lativittatus]|nr:COBW domain-containing protein 1 [Coelomomyces lativittatus]
MLQMDETNETEHTRVPLTIVTGLLGSGKSTLLKHIMKVHHGKRIAIIMNEFGDTLDIEKSLFVHEGALTSQEWLELKNGCLCCSIKDSGVKAIESLMEKKGAFDFIILETTGLADPQSIISIFWVDDSLHSDIYLDGVITVVDANASKQISDHSNALHALAVKQIAMADRILLNKCDLLSDEDIPQIESAIKEINEATPIFRTLRSIIDVNEILEIHAFDNKAPSMVDGFSILPNTEHFQIDETTTTVTLRTSIPIDSEALKIWLGNLLWENLLWENKPHSMEIWRLKDQ